MKSEKPRAAVYHLQINVSNARRSLPFYKTLLSYFGYKLVDASPGHIGMSDGTTDFWILQSEKAHSQRKFHRKSPGLNHIAFRVPSKAAVEKFARQFLRKWKIKTLYSSPKHFPEYHPDYYAVYFEDPDRIKWEVTYIPRKR